MSWIDLGVYAAIGLGLIGLALLARRIAKFDLNPQRGSRAALWLVFAGFLALGVRIAATVKGWHIPYDLPHLVGGFCWVWATVELKQSAANRGGGSI